VDFTRREGVGGDLHPLMPPPKLLPLLTFNFFDTFAFVSCVCLLSFYPHGPIVHTYIHTLRYNRLWIGNNKTKFYSFYHVDSEISKTHKIFFTKLTLFSQLFPHFPFVFRVTMLWCNVNLQGSVLCVPYVTISAFIKFFLSICLV